MSGSHLINTDAWRCWDFLRLARLCDRSDTRSGLVRKHNAANPKKARNLLGNGYFERLHRCLGSQSPLRGFSYLVALDSLKIAHCATYRY